MRESITGPPPKAEGEPEPSALTMSKLPALNSGFLLLWLPAAKSNAITPVLARERFDAASETPR
jgi:hypothetical protein